MINKIIQGDCIEVMKTMPDNHIDTIITDPPYGLSFMGKKWDYDVPSIEIWKECLRVLKPGGTALIFAGSRTQHRMAVNVEDAGFILKDTIMWLYGSGFPKATDISKQLDKGVERKVVGYDENMAKRNPNPKTGISITGNENNQIREVNPDITEPATPEAKLWNGWKSHGLKPAYEPILVAMKPNEGSYAENALKYGVAGLNIDGGRIEYSEDNKPIPQLAQDKRDIKTDNKMYGRQSFTESKTKSTIGGSLKGRFPANIILDEEAGKMLDEQSGETTQGHWANTKVTGYGKTTDYKGVGRKAQDKGGASRFFYCAKASKSERNMGCEGLEEKEGGSLEGGIDKRTGKTNQPKRKNNHPTVKPLKLMEYLCNLTKTPTGGIVLDPFCGSGTTLMAAKLTGREYIGIEREQEYIEIAKCRVDAVKIENDLF